MFPLRGHPQRDNGGRDLDSRGCVSHEEECGKYIRIQHRRADTMPSLQPHGVTVFTILRADWVFSEFNDSWLSKHYHVLFGVTYVVITGAGGGSLGFPACLQDVGQKEKSKKGTKNVTSNSAVHVFVLNNLSTPLCV